MGFSEQTQRLLVPCQLSTQGINFLSTRVLPICFLARMVPSNSLLPCLAAMVIFISPLAMAEDDLNCDIQGWMEPGYVPPENPDCHPFDGSLVPDCGKYLVNNVTSYYHIHEYNCSRFWECGPEGACLFECASCPSDNDQCMGEEALWFDCKYQYPEGPVCDWPNGVDCATSTPKPTNVPTTEPKTTTTTPKPTTTPEGFCLVDDDCSNTPCSSCENQQCYDPECCEDANCPLITEMSCSVCTKPELTCTDPECCTDSDCEAGYVCQNQLCVLEGECDAQRPCDGEDEICNLPGHENCQYCSHDLNCENG